MKLPRFADAIVPPGKIVDYLLSDTHRDGRHKAEFFRRFGFAVDHSDVLDEALRGIASNNEVICEEISSFGSRYVVDGIMKTPDGRSAFVRTVWFIEHGQSAPRLVTAYPAPLRS